MEEERLGKPPPSFLTKHLPFISSRHFDLVVLAAEPYSTRRVQVSNTPIPHLTPCLRLAWYVFTAALRYQM